MSRKISALSNFPFADEDNSNPNSQLISSKVHEFNGPGKYKNNPQIVINSPEKDKEAANGVASPCVEGGDELGPLAETINTTREHRKRSLRRNSISLPTGLEQIDLEALRASHIDHPANRVTEDDSNSNTTSHSCSITAMDDDDITDDECKVPLRMPRRKSVAPLPALRITDQLGLPMDNVSDISAQNSITSINSLASLLKEKMQMFPAMIKKKKKPNSEYRIRAFVGLLFLIIVFLVGYAYVVYHQQVLAKTYFDKIKFNKAKRLIRVYDKQGLEIVSGKLGTTVNLEHSYKCIKDPSQEDNGGICLEWMDHARLYLNYESRDSELHCYTIRWQSLNKNINPTDCYDWSKSQGSWYGGGQTRDSKWPLEKGSHDFAPFVTGDVKKHQWGNVLKRYFINSKGAAIVINDDTPLHISINNNGNEQFCLRAQQDDFAYVNRITELPELNYRICTASNMKMLYTAMSEQSLWDGLTTADNDVINSLLSEPVWQISPPNKQELTEAMIYNYTEDIIASGYLKQGHVLVNEFWQNNIGDFTLDTERFPTLEDTVKVIHRRGFRIVFSFQPFISTESHNFAECVQQRLLISERFSDRRIPALSRYKSLTSAGVLDVTNNRTIPWLNAKLAKILESYKIDAFYLDYGVAYNMPHYYQCEKMLTNPDQYKTLLTSTLSTTTNLIGVSGAVKVPKPPTFVSLPPFNSTWESLQRLIPTVLSYGVIGYPFLLPGAVGGDIDEKFILETSSNNGQTLPDKELYIRWFQLATFLPVIRFTYLPNKYNDENILDIAKSLTNLRQKTVTPLLKKYSRQALDVGLPLIRPLWLLDPTDTACLQTDDEFAVGEELIIAPVLYKGNTQREVYLPAGVWKDGIDGSLRKGSRWIHNYKVPLDKVAYFVKMPDNTRF